MREKSWKFIITFHTTSEAIAVERYCREKELPGRLIPVPRAISASCGMAWCVPLEQKELLGELLVRFGQEMDRTYELEI